MFKLKQQKSLPIELLAEIFKSLNFYPNEMLCEIINEKIKTIFIKLSSSSQLFYFFSGKCLKEKYKRKMDADKKEEEAKQLIQTQEEIIKIKDEENAKLKAELSQALGTSEQKQPSTQEISSEDQAVLASSPKKGELKPKYLHKNRTLSSFQKTRLHEVFANKPDLKGNNLVWLSEELRLPLDQVQAWFTNRRVKINKERKMMQSIREGSSAVPPLTEDDGDESSGSDPSAATTSNSVVNKSGFTSFMVKDMLKDDGKKQG